MQTNYSTLHAPKTAPKNFDKFVEPELGRYRGFEITSSDGKTITVGETTDITKFVKDYFIKNNGKLVVRLKDDCRHIFDSRGEVDRTPQNRGALDATDAVLNQLGIAFFEKLSESPGTPNPVIGLIDGRKTALTRIVYGKGEKMGSRWYREHFDDQETRPIKHYGVMFAFNNGTFKQEKDGSKFSIKLSGQYKVDESVRYAVHHVLGQRCGITERVKESKILERFI